MPFSDFYANNILNWTFGKGSLSNHSEVYIGLCSNDPEADLGQFNELSGNGYARVLIAKSGSAYPDVIGTANDREIKNAKQINWTKASPGAWETAKGFGLFTTASGGGLPYFYGKLTSPVTCAAGAVMLFDPNTLQISFPETT